MIYILLALALLGALTMAMMRGNETGGDDLSKDEAEVLATKVIAYSAAAKNVVDQMIMSGTPVASLNFVIPSEATFNTGSHIHKVFHPAGGGLAYQTFDSNMKTSTASSTAGWYVVRFNNVEWTPTTNRDVIIVAYQLKKEICENINKKITGNTTIPTLNGSMAEYLLGIAHGAGAEYDLTATACSGCSGYPALCLSNAGATAYSYYSVISPQ